MKLRCLLAVFVLQIAVGGCTTPYQSAGLTGGFTDTKIDEQTWRVRFDGNGHTPKDMVWNFWIYRCASLTIEKGYSGFTIESIKKPAPPSTPSTPTIPQKSESPPIQKIMLRLANPLGSESIYFAGDTHSGGITSGLYIPSNDNKNLFLKTKGSGGGGYYYVPGGSYSVTTWHSDAIVHMFKENTIPTNTKAWLRASTIVELLAPYVKSNGQELAPSRDYILMKSMIIESPNGTM